MIKSGYQLHITTWENDGDNYSTQIFSGLTEADVKFYVHIVTRFASRNDWVDTGLPKLGNQYNKLEILIDLANEALAANPDISKNIRDSWNSYIEGEYCEDIIELYNELLGVPGEYYDDYGFCRVFETLKVFYFPTEVEEVTKRFR